MKQNFNYNMKTSINIEVEVDLIAEKLLASLHPNFPNKKGLVMAIIETAMTNNTMTSIVLALDSIDNEEVKKETFEYFTGLKR